MGHLAAAVADNALCGLLKRAGIQRVRVIPEGRQAQLGPPLLLVLRFLRRFGLGESIMIAPVFRIVLQRAQPLEGLFIGTISDLAEQFIGCLLYTSVPLGSTSMFAVKCSSSYARVGTASP